MANKTSKDKSPSKGKKSKPVTKCDQSEEVIANCDNLEKGEISLSQHEIEKLIITIRGKQVLIDRDLAMIYIC